MDKRRNLKKKNQEKFKVRRFNTEKILNNDVFTLDEFLAKRGCVWDMYKSEVIEVKEVV